ncbi:RidA family protein [Celeribacter arenosi]|uniref:Enamine deaminase RidA, house cleaning of reactive enamine intermediates, YjgF/YER057c/UK114 family n=1 Tax=Celeribacter arenosi TaxID=792649 RepID=A0ABP7JW17_9RHOB
MAIKRIHSGSPYEPKIGYCRATVTDGWVFVSGSTGADPVTRTMPQDVREQCRNTLDVIGRALAEAGASFSDVVRVNYVLPDRADFELCWPILAEVFGDNPPAAMMIVAGLIDAEMKIEIEVTARLPGTQG